MSQLLQQIQREMEEEARLERFIEKRKHKILKLPENRRYRLVDSKDKAHAFLVIDRNELDKYSIFANEDDEVITKMEESSDLYVFPLRNTNPRDSKKSTAGYIRSTLIPTNYINIQN